MLDEVGIIHMNGRIYDAKLGRFLQADPLIQDPFDTQSLNRYSYTGNNPLNAIDPSGFSFFKKLLTIIIVVVISIVTYGAASAWAAGTAWGAGAAAGTLSLSGAMAAGAIAGAVSGFASGLIMTGTLKGALTGAAFGALSGAAFGAIGHSFGKLNVGVGNGIRAGKNLYLSTANFVKLIASQGLAGGVMSVIQGGKFGHGFATAGLTKAATPTILSFDNVVAETIASSVVGGTASKVTGGKFSNGATSGAILYAANACSSGDCWEEFKSAFTFKAAFSPGLGVKAKVAGVEVSTGMNLSEGLEGDLSGKNNAFVEGEATLFKVKAGKHAFGLGAKAHADLITDGNSEFEYDIVKGYSKSSTSVGFYKVGVEINPVLFKVGIEADLEKMYDSVSGAIRD